MDEKLYRSLIAERQAVQRDVFAHPPADYSAFCERKGRWMQLNDIIQQMEADAKAKDN